MKASGSLILIAFFSLCILVGEAQIGVRQGNAAGSSVLKEVTATSQQSASVPALAGDSARTQQVTQATSKRFEPLLLLLFGSTLLSVGTAINLMLARKLKRESAQAMTASK